MNYEVPKRDVETTHLDERQRKVARMRVKKLFQIHVDKLKNQIQLAVCADHVDEPVGSVVRLG